MFTRGQNSGGGGTEVQKITANITVPASGWGTTNISYGKTYDVVPTVAIVNPYIGRGELVQATNITTTGFTAQSKAFSTYHDTYAVDFYVFEPIN